jgi:hypothetical protein
MDVSTFLERSIPSDVSIRSLTLVDDYDDGSIRKLIYEYPFILIDKMNVKFTMNIFKNKNDIEKQKIYDIKIKNESYDKSKQMDFMEEYIKLNKEDFFYGDGIKLRILKKLLGFYFGIIPDNQIINHEIIHLIFPFLRVKEVKGDGDCYYHSVGENVNLSAKEIRKNLLDFINKNKNRDELVNNILSNCVNKASLLKNFDNIFVKNCDSKGEDCKDCIWGTNELDPMLTEIYDRPVYSFYFEEPDEDIYIKREEIPIFKKDKEYSKLFDRIFKFLSNGYPNIKFVKKRFELVLSINKSKKDTQFFIGHYHKNSHFDGIEYLSDKDKDRPEVKNKKKVSTPKKSPNKEKINKSENLNVGAKRLDLNILSHGVPSKEKSVLKSKIELIPIEDLSWGNENSITPTKKVEKKMEEQIVERKYDKLMSEVEWYRKNCEKHPPKDILIDERESVSNLTVKQFIEIFIKRYDSASILLENIKDPGFTFEGLWTIMIFFNIFDKFPKNKYKLLDGNVNKGISKLESYRPEEFLNKKFISSNSSGVSDITLERISESQKIRTSPCDKKYVSSNGDYVLMSSKFYKNEKYISDYDLQKLHSIILSDNGFSNPIKEITDSLETMSQELITSVKGPKKLPRLVLLVKNKIGLYKKIQSSNRSSQYLLYGLDKDNDIYDLNDLDIYYSKLKQLLNRFDYNFDTILTFLDDKDRHQFLNLRFHQELIVNKSMAILNSNKYRELLWGCVPRSGKTFMMGGLYRMMIQNKISNALILTPSPNETMKEYEDLFLDYIDFNNVTYIRLNSDKNNLLNNRNMILDDKKNYVFTASKQFFDYHKENKDDIVEENLNTKDKYDRKNLNKFFDKVKKLDILFYDENHYGGTSGLSQIFLDNMKKKFPNLIIVYVTATYNKPMNIYDLPKANILEWKLDDISLMKQIDKTEGVSEEELSKDRQMMKSDEEFFLSKSYFVNLLQLRKNFGKEYVDKAFMEIFNRGSKIEEVKAIYEAFPDVHILTQTFIKESVDSSIREIKDNLMCNIFKLIKVGNEYRFEQRNNVNKILNIIAGTRDGPLKTENFFQRIREISLNLNSRTTLDGSPFTSQIWYLPYPCEESPIVQVLQLLKIQMMEHPILRDFEIYNVKEDDSDIKKKILDVEEDAKRNGKLGLIILSGKQLGLGISLPCVDVVVMLNDGGSGDDYYQRMFRALTESEGKKMGFVVDLNPTRQFDTVYDYVSNTKITNEKEFEEEMTNPKKSKLIYIDYDLFRTEKIDPKKVRDFFQEFINKRIDEDMKNRNKALSDIVITDELFKDINDNIGDVIYDIFSDDKDKKKKKQRLVEGEEILDESMIEVLPLDVSISSSMTSELDVNKKKTSRRTIQPNIKDNKMKMIKVFLERLINLLIILTYNQDPKNMNDMIQMIMETKQKKPCDGNLYVAFESRVNNIVKDESKVKYIMRFVFNTENMNSIEGINILLNKILEEFKERLKEMSRKSPEKANIHNEGELMCLIKDRLTPRNKEKKLFGEVFTPLWLVERMINQVPEDFYHHPEYKILGPSVGIGNFQVGLYYKLMETLKDKIPNEEKRRKHILENMLYMIELNEDNREVLENILNPERKYKLNIRCGDFLTMDVLKEFGLMEGFDMVMENPPYNSDMQTGRAKISLWDKFVINSLNVIKNNGYLVMVHPSKWRQPEHKMWDVITNNQILYLELHDKKDGKKTFQSDTRYDWYVLQKTPYKKSTIVIDTLGKKSIINLNKIKFLPNYLMEEISQLINLNKSEQLEVYYDSSTYGNNQPNKDKSLSTFKYPVVTALNKDGPIIKYFDTNINKSKQKGWKKVILSSNEVIRHPINDFEAKYGISNNTFGIAINSEKQGNELIKAITSEFFTKVIEATKWQTFQIDYHMFKYFDKNFYKHPLITSWKGLEPVKNPIGKVPDEDDCSKITEIGRRVSPKNSGFKSPRTNFKNIEQNMKHQTSPKDKPIFIQDQSDIIDEQEIIEEIETNLTPKSRLSPSRETSPQRIETKLSPKNRRSPSKENTSVSTIQKSQQKETILSPKNRGSPTKILKLSQMSRLPEREESRTSFMDPWEHESVTTADTEMTEDSFTKTVKSRRTPRPPKNIPDEQKKLILSKIIKQKLEISRQKNKGYTNTELKEFIKELGYTIPQLKEDRVDIIMKEINTLK